MAARSAGVAQTAFARSRAVFERELIRARTGEGRKRAKDRGVRFGRPRKMTPHQRQEALRRLAAGETMADVARTYAVDATTIGRLASSSPFERGAVGRGGAGTRGGRGRVARLPCAAGGGWGGMFPRDGGYPAPRSNSGLTTRQHIGERPCASWIVQARGLDQSSGPNTLMFGLARVCAQSLGSLRLGLEDAH